MSNNDRFVAIAEHNPGMSPDMEVLEPIKLPIKDFKESKLQAEKPMEFSFEERKIQFKDELQVLRDKYRPFLKNYAPVDDFKRNKMGLDKFDFRIEKEEDKKDFTNVLDGLGEWEEVTIPDFKGPTGYSKSFYRCEFEALAKNEEKFMFLCFKGVDYIANVYLNRKYIGSHTGFFAPFEFDVTDDLKYSEKNVILVEVINDATTCGDGDKIYAATGPGWDDSEVGWHHCPSGTGIYNKVYLEERGQLFVHSIFVRPNINNADIEAWVEVFNTKGRPLGDGEAFISQSDDFELYLSVYPANFEGEAIEKIKCEVAPAGHGINYYRFTIPMEGFRLWESEKPWLYSLKAEVVYKDKSCDILSNKFGMRTVHMDETAEVKGTLYLNNTPIILRGANEMGHLQQCVMNEDYDQLVDDILIAKMANMNYFRITQRPVQEEIYDYFDALGMLQQCDFPLFGYLRRNIFAEGVKQAEEMERLVRSHPSTVMITYINENFDFDQKKYGHRYLYRDELEFFFKAATQAVKIQNPDRVIKNCEGDYDPPTWEGLSDFHCYNMWYTNHALPIGKMHKGYMPQIKKNWKAGCGEYGTEGLDPLHIMMERYPKEWIPKNIEDKWMPDKIVMAQTTPMHGDWYEEQYNITDWITESQKHQVNATKLMNDALRRRSDRIISTALHLFIDAWPSGWMKTIVACDRTPKPAFFAFKDSLIPVRINLRTDRFTYTKGETVTVEAWALNDTAVELKDCKVVATVEVDGKNISSFEMDVDSKALWPTYAGMISFKAPEDIKNKKIKVYATLYDKDMNTINNEKIELGIFKKVSDEFSKDIVVYGEKKLNIFKNAKVNAKAKKVLLVATGEDFLKNEEEIITQVKNGEKAIVFLEKGGSFEQWSYEDIKIKCGGLNSEVVFLARNKNNSVTEEFTPYDFSYWYNTENDMIDHIGKGSIEGDKIEAILFSYDKDIKNINKETGEKKKRVVVGSVKIGKGEIVFSKLEVEGFEKNPVYIKFMKNLIEK